MQNNEESPLLGHRACPSSNFLSFFRLRSHKAGSQITWMESLAIPQAELVRTLADVV